MSSLTAGILMSSSIIDYKKTGVDIFLKSKQDSFRKNKI